MRLVVFYYEGPDDAYGVQVPAGPLETMLAAARSDPGLQRAFDGHNVAGLDYRVE